MVIKMNINKKIYVYFLFYTIFWRTQFTLSSSLQIFIIQTNYPYKTQDQPAPQHNVRKKHETHIKRPEYGRWRPDVIPVNKSTIQADSLSPQFNNAVINDHFLYFTIGRSFDSNSVHLWIFGWRQMFVEEEME